MLGIYSLAFAWLVLRSNATTIRSRTDAPADLRVIFTNPDINWSPQTDITFPGDEDFELATTRWTVFRPPTYQAAVSPATEADVVTAVS